MNHPTAPCPRRLAGALPLFFVLVVSANARADSSAIFQSSGEQSSGLYPPKEDEKSALVAVMTSIGMTVGVMAIGIGMEMAWRDSFAPPTGAGYVLAAVGLLVGPSAGQIYAGEVGKAWAFIGLRTASLAGAGLFLAFALATALGDRFETSHADPSPLADPTLWLVLSGAGVASSLGFAVFSIIDGVASCNKHNKSFALNRSWGLQPTVLAAINDNQENRLLPGLAFSTSF